MGKLSREKGKRGEREVAELLRKHGLAARRGQQFRGGADSPDVVVEGSLLHVEVKRTETLALWPAMTQAAEEAPPGAVPVVVHRPSKRRWVVILDAEDFLLLTRKALGPESSKAVGLGAVDK